MNGVVGKSSCRYMNPKIKGKIIIIIIIIIIFWKFLTPAFADSFSQGFEWQQVPSSLFSLFWPILIMLWCGWSLLVFLFQSLPLPLPIVKRLFRVHQLQLVSLSSLVFFSSLTRSRYLSLFSFSFNFTLWSAETAKSTIRHVLFFFSFLFFFFFFFFFCCC